MERSAIRDSPLDAECLSANFRVKQAPDHTAESVAAVTPDYASLHPGYVGRSHSHSLRQTVPQRGHQIACKGAGNIE